MWKWFVSFAIISAIGAQKNVVTKSISTAINRFSFKFFNELDKSKNIVCSPLSAEFVLALLALGTTGATHSELLTSLDIADDDSIRSSFTAVASKLNTLNASTLNIANKLYIKNGSYVLNPQIEEDAVIIFDAGIDKLNFNDSVLAAKTINGWIKNKTNQKITQLVSEDSIDSETRLVIINAVYFKGTWKYLFNTSNTMEQKFFLNGNSTVQVPMMYNQDDYSLGFSKVLQAHLLEIPYAGEETTMLIVLPEAIEGLHDVLAKLGTGHDLMIDMDQMMLTNVHLTIPKFKIEAEVNLKELLPKLGINGIFNSNPGLIKIINNDEPLYVSNAVQKAFIEVNEEGAEATAATGMVSILRRASPEFSADRPFLFLLLGPNRIPFLLGSYRGIT